MSTKRQKIIPSPAITQARISTRSMHDAERRAAIANRALDHWDRVRDQHPKIPNMAQEWSEQAAIDAAQRVVEVCAEIRASQPPAPTMDEVVESIKLKPATRPIVPHFVTPDVIRLAERLPVLIGVLAVFLAGLSVGAAL